MRKSRFTDSQLMAILKQAEAKYGFCRMQCASPRMSAKVRTLGLKTRPPLRVGLGSSIFRSELVTIDDGYERGKTSEQLFKTFTNHLIDRGFRMGDINQPLARPLYRNVRVESDAS